MRSAFPDLHIAVEDTVAEGDKVAVCLHVTGTHKGGGLGFPATGRKVDVTAITIIQFANGQLVHGWNNWDQLGMMQQPGMTPARLRPGQYESIFGEARLGIFTAEMLIKPFIDLIAVREIGQ
jgi:hypothetical protein